MSHGADALAYACLSGGMEIRAARRAGKAIIAPSIDGHYTVIDEGEKVVDDFLESRRSVSVPTGTKLSR
ncbi:hypothetical protein [Maricaulis sp.]|uniref:hypothetical protein n=1 Tax=Maricaulis sp. TaxID=1486257 RepID=UPI003298B0EF